jgi:hypothetical protein
MREYLVFVRAGRGSLHPGWLSGDTARNWDCCVNGWGAQAPEADGARAEWHETGGLNKFAGFQRIYPEKLARHGHRLVLLLDDDLAFAPGDISRFFAHFESAGLDIGQPAIELGSHANHLVNIRNPFCRVRRVNFVEVMAPCFERSTLEELLPTFSLTQCTWGIDWAWSSLLRNRARMGIVDAVAMRHTKPMDVSGGPFYERLRSLGVDPAAELQSVYDTYPAWGPMQTLDDGHVHRWPLPRALNRLLVAGFEQRKHPVHTRRGGTVAVQTPPRNEEPAGARTPLARLSTALRSTGLPVARHEPLNRR